ncbi:MAG: hypothetical protein ACE5GE_01875 [Phycisphaerae bacterium]
MPETSTTDSLKLHNVQVDDLLTLGADAPLDLDEVSAAPATPDAGKVRLYAKGDGRLYQKDDTGAETALDASTAGAVMNALFDANTVLAADADNLPQAVTVSNDRLLGRADSGGIAALDAAAVMGILSTALVPPLRASSWYDGTPPFGTGQPSGSATLVADRIYAIPFWTPWRTTWDQIGIEVTTADVGKKIKLGIYDVGIDALPGSLVFGGGELGLDSVGAVSNTAIAQTLSPGLYYLAVRSNSSAAQVTRVSRSSVRFLPVSQLSDTGAASVYSNTGTYAANGLPATFPSSPVLDTLSVTLRPMLKSSATP